MTIILYDNLTATPSNLIDCSPYNNLTRISSLNYQQVPSNNAIETGRFWLGKLLKEGIANGDILSGDIMKTIRVWF